MTQGQAFALQNALQSTDFRNGLAAFFDAEHARATAQCRDAMKLDPPKIERAIGFTGQAIFAEEAFNRLEDFTRQQIERVA